MWVINSILGRIYRRFRKFFPVSIYYLWPFEMCRLAPRHPVHGIITISPYFLSYLLIMSLLFMLFYYLNLSITLEDFNTATNHCHCNLHGSATLMKWYHKDSYSFIGKCGKIQIFGNETNRSKLYLWRNEEEIKIGECLLLLNTHLFIQFWCEDDNMIVPAVWCEWNLFTHTKGRNLLRVFGQKEVRILGSKRKMT